MASLRKNFLFDVLNTTSSILFPLITFPYVSRILQAEGLGTVAFLESIVNYIVIFVGLGIPVYAVREIARVKENNTELVKTSKEILTIHMLMGVLGYIVVIVLVLFVSQINQNLVIFLILSLGIFFNIIAVNWFFYGTEQFVYISIRGLIIRCFSLLALFLFVNTREDIVIYSLIYVASEAGNCIVNFWRFNKLVDLRQVPLKELELYKHIPDIMKLFISAFAVTIYFNLDNIMIGFIDSEVSVGYYSPALKVQRVLMGVIISVGNVVFPRLSSLSKKENKDLFFSLSLKATQIVISFSLPIMVAVVLLAIPIIRILAGDGFIPSVLTLQLLAPVILLGSLSNITSKVLISLGKENLMTIATVVGAGINLTTNAILITLFSHRGAALASSFSELCVCLTMLLLGRKYLKYSIFTVDTYKYIIASLLMGVTLFLFQTEEFSYCNFIISFVIGILSYFTALLLLKEGLIILSTKEYIRKMIYKLSI